MKLERIAVNTGASLGINLCKSSCCYHQWDGFSRSRMLLHPPPFKTGVFDGSTCFDAQTEWQSFTETERKYRSGGNVKLALVA
ncbi:hypothetical protein FQA39_LY05199 [Lamprigera yunnana]|nr:hypothetical protein FQA39_LY05199 [Lamprigera yunnana]